MSSEASGTGDAGDMGPSSADGCGEIAPLPSPPLALRLFGDFRKDRASERPVFSIAALDACPVLAASLRVKPVAPLMALLVFFNTPPLDR
jgi:hypothetical protein